LGALHIQYPHGSSQTVEKVDFCLVLISFERKQHEKCFMTLF
jgi:hypothetical protein